MANELRLSLSIQAEKGNFKWPMSVGQVNVDMASGARGGYVQTIGTLEEVIGGLTDVTTFGWAFFRNLDATNFVEIGPESGGAMVSAIKLLAGEWACFPVKPGITLRAKADTAAVRLDCNVLSR